MFFLFTQYAHPFEKKVHRFFQHVHSSGNPKKTEQRLLALMQENTIVVHLWMEKRFKNYRYLHRYRRKKLYAHAEKITTLFNSFYREYRQTLSKEEMQKTFAAHSIPFPEKNIEQLRCLFSIAAFLQPGRYYHYISSASFGKLLRDPEKEQLEGDCNQIVTLYTHLYSRYFPLSDLQIKLLPDHVCLHAFGMDIEATAGTMTHYPTFETIGQITELAAVNLLDVSDAREMQSVVTPKTLVQAASLAYHLSSMRDLVTRNLRISYHNMAIAKTKDRNFAAALTYAKKIEDNKLIEWIAHAATRAALEKKNFTQARSYAKMQGNAKLFNHVLLAEGSHAQQKKQFRKARELFQKAGNTELVRSTYQSEYNALLKKIPSSLKTVQDHAKYKQTYKKLLVIAKKGGLREQTAQLQQLLKQL